MYTTRRFALNPYVYTRGAELNQFDFGSICETAFTRVVRMIAQWLLVQSSSIRVAQSEVVPSELKQLNSIRVYTMSETEPVWIDLNLRASVNRLLVGYAALGHCAMLGVVKSF